MPADCWFNRHWPNQYWNEWRATGPRYTCVPQLHRACCLHLCALVLSSRGIKSEVFYKIFFHFWSRRARCDRWVCVDAARVARCARVIMIARFRKITGKIRKYHGKIRPVQTAISNIEQNIWRNMQSDIENETLLTNALKRYLRGKIINNIEIKPILLNIESLVKIDAF